MVATLGAVLFGGVLGGLQWLVILTGRMLLWVLAPSAVLSQKPATT